MKPPLSFMVPDNQKGETTFPVFSDGDLASRFLQTCEHRDDFKIIAVTSVQMLAEALKGCHGLADAMSFDQHAMSTRPYAIWPLEYAVERVEAGEML